MRLTNPEPAELKAVAVVPAPKISSLAEVVIAVPLLAVAPLPEAAAPVSSGLVLSKPLYSRILTSGYAAALLNVTMTVFAPAAMFFA